AAQSCFVTVSFGRPGGDEQKRSNYCAANQSRKARVPTVMLDDKSQAPARKHGARVTENAGQTNRGGGGALGGKIHTSDGQQTLRAVDKKPRGAKQAGNEQL